MAALLWMGTACGGTCRDYCDYRLACAEEDARCDLRRPDRVHDDCYDDCGRAMDRLRAEEAEELDACVACVAEEIGTPDECNDGDYSDARDFCDRECDERGVDEFFDRFDLDLDSRDFDC